MSRLCPTLVCLGLLSLVGCHAPRPTFQSLMPAPRVAPPATGQHGSPDSYYDQRANPNAVAPSVSASETPRAADGSAVSLAHHQVVVGGESGNGAAARVTAAGTSSATGSPLRLRGMPVSDATGVEPRAFEPSGAVREITALPASPATMPATTRRLPASAAPAAASTPTLPAAAVRSATTGWQQRSS